MTSFAFVAIIWGMFSRLIYGLIEIIYPKRCLGCGKRLVGKHQSSVEEFICLNCQSLIKRNLPPFCRSCGRRLNPKACTSNICTSCIKNQMHFDRAFSPFLYEDTVRTLIHEFKYKRKDYLGEILANLMIDFIAEYSLPIDYLDLIIPIPLHKTKLREREFNQAQVLSEYIGKKFNKPVINNVLTRNRLTKTQTGMNNQERFLNAKGSFSLTDNFALEGKNILLVDDVLTTGATSSEASYVLKNAGANIVFVLTLAS